MINLHLVRGVVRNDSRVLKEATTLAASGLFTSVEIVGLNDAGLPEDETIAGLPVHRVTLTSRGWSRGLAAQVLKFAEWRRRILRREGGRPLAVVHCHDIDPLPIGLRLRELTGAKVLYDAHELETEQGWSSRTRVALYKAMERRMVRRVDAMVTVSDGIARWYHEAYGIPSPALVRNVPVRPEAPIVPIDLRTMLGVPPGALLFLYLGALLPGRGIEQIVAAFGRPGVPHHLLCIGYGPLASQVLAAARDCARIHFRDAVPPDQVLRHAAGADVGISMILDSCLSHRWCLPNKLFESVIAGLPVLVSDLPEQRAFVERHRAGWVCEPAPDAVAATLRSITVDVHAAVRAGLAERTAALGWHQEAEVLLRVYHQLLGRSPATVA